MAADGAQQRSAPAPLHRNRDFGLLWTGQAVSGMGSAISGICYPLLILAITGSAAEAGIVSGASLIANLVLLLPAGVVADRYPRKRLMVSSSLVQAVAVGTVVPPTLGHHVYIAQLAGVGAVQGAASAFFTGAGRGAVRRVVPPAQLPQAYARIEARDQAVSLAGAPAGGALFSLAQFLPFACDAVSFGCIAVATAFIRKPLDPHPAATGPREPLRRSITAGVRFIFSVPLLRTIALWGTAVNGISAGMLLLIIVLARAHGGTPAIIGLLLSVSAAAGMAAALVAGRLVAMAGGRTLALLASWLLPASATAMALAPSLWLIGACGAVTTVLVAPVNITFAAYAAQVTPDHLQAQAGNAMRLSVGSLTWLTPPVFGLLADSLGLRAAMLTGAGLLALTAIGLHLAPHLAQLAPRSTPGAERPASGSAT
jgi:MFS family permease